MRVKEGSAFSPVPGRGLVRVIAVVVTVHDRFFLKRREENLRKVAFGLGLESKKDFRRERWEETNEQISGNGALAEARTEG